MSYLVALPRVVYYEKVSRQIYGIYLMYIAPENIVVYSIDELFVDATAYLNHYKMSAHDLAITMIQEVLYTTGITATSGIGTNLYLAKPAMNITAKHTALDTALRQSRCLTAAPTVAKSNFRKELPSGRLRRKRFKICPGQELKMKNEKNVYSSSNVGEEHTARFI